MNHPHREHPAALPRNLSFYLWLLLLPLIRGIHYIRLSGNVPSWLRSSQPDWVAAGVLALCAIILWWHRTYTVSPHDLHLRRGVLFRRTTRIPLPLITTLTVERPLWLRLFGAAQVVADTDAGNHRMADLHLTVSRRQAAVFLPDNNRARFRAAGWRICLLSVLASDSFGGFLLLATVFRHGSILLGEGLRRTVLDNLESAADALALIPRTAALLTLLLAAAWLTGTVRLLLRHLPFAACRNEDTLTIYTGAVTPRIHCCALGAINYLDRPQTLAAYLLHLHTVYISCTGYGKDRNTRAVLVPPCRRKQAQLESTLFLPSLAHHTIHLRPAKGALWRYWRLPLILLGLLPLARFVFLAIFPLWRDLITYLTLMAVLPCLWLLAVRFVDRRTAGLGFEKGSFCLSYSRYLTLHRVTIPQHKVAAIHIRQSLWQAWRGTCNIKIYSNHEFRHPHPVRHLRRSEVQQLLDSID